MKKTVVTAENMNSMIQYQKRQIEEITKKLTEKHKSEVQAILGGLRILEFEYKEALADLTAKNEVLRTENERLKAKG